MSKLLASCIILSALVAGSMCALFSPRPVKAEVSTYTEVVNPSGYADPSTGVVIVYSVHSVQTPDGVIVLEIPADALTSPTEITITEASGQELVASVPPPPSGFSLADTCFTFEGVDSLEESAKFIVRYSDADLAAADGSPYPLRLARYDEGDGKWTVLTTKRDATNESLRAATDGLGKFAVVVKKPAKMIPGLSRGQSVIIGLIVGVAGIVAIGIVLDRKVFKRKQPSPCGKSEI